MARASIFSIVERTQPPGSSILCFDRRYRMTFVSNEAEKICLALFGCQATEGQALPAPLRELVLKLNGRKSSADAKSGPPSIFSLPDGSPVRTRLVPDPEKLHHCLIFEHETVLSNPGQLKPLGLSARETEIAFWLYQKKTNWEIGRILEVSTRTVEKHIENIYRKLDVNNRENLATKLRQNCSGNGAPVTPG